MGLEHRLFVRQILDQVQYKDWQFHIIDKNGSTMIQCQWWGRDTKTGEMDLQKSRKWYVSPYATESEIVQTAFLAIKTAEEHEMREHFRYRLSRVFGPHLPVRELIRVGHTEEVREEADCCGRCLQPRPCDCQMEGRSFMEAV